jgi:hypothetical protein
VRIFIKGERLVSAPRLQGGQKRDPVTQFKNVTLRGIIEQNKM